MYMFLQEMADELMPDLAFERTFNGQPVQFELSGVETGFYHVVLRNGQQQGAKRLLIH